MIDQTILLKFGGQGALVISLAILIGWALNRARLSYLAGILCSVAAGASAVIGVYLDEGVSFPPQRDWHYIAFATLITGLLIAILQFRRMPAIVDAVIVVIATAIVSQLLFPEPGSDESFDQYRTWWIVIPLLAAASNVLILRWIDTDPRAAWTLWVLVAQLALIAVSLMLAYAKLANVALGLVAVAAIAATGAAIICLLASRNPNQTSLESGAEYKIEDRPADASGSHIGWLQLTVAPLILSAMLLTVCVRTYGFGTIDAWLYVPMFFMPSIVCLVDLLFFSKFKTMHRTLIAAGLTTAISATAMVYIYVVYVYSAENF